VVTTAAESSHLQRGAKERRISFGFIPDERNFALPQLVNQNISQEGADAQVSAGNREVNYVYDEMPALRSNRHEGEASGSVLVHILRLEIETIDSG
jgi:hypothetical protein